MMVKKPFQNDNRKKQIRQMMLTDIPLDLNLLPELRGAYLVGGTTRDLLLGLNPVDYDIAVSQNPENFARMTAARCHGHLVPMGRPGKMSYRVVTGRTILDITGLNGPTIQNDLESRDVTVNAIALDLAAGTLVDHVGGMRDLSEKRIRMVSDAGFKKDPVRLIRVFRLAAVLGFSIDRETLAAVSRDVNLIRLTAGERIRSELHALFSSRKSHPRIVQMAETGLLTAIFPELAPLQTTTSEVYPEPDLLSHSLAAYGLLEPLLSDPPDILRDRADAASPLHPDQAPWLKCAMLLHHIDPPSITPSENQTGQDDLVVPESFAAEKLSVRLRLSGSERKLVTVIVRRHETPFHLYDGYTKNTIDSRAAARFFLAHETLTPHLMLHARADAQSEIPGRRYHTEAFSVFFQDMLDTYYNAYLPQKTYPPLVTGHDLIRFFHLTPSPLIGKVLNRLEEERLSGNLPDRETALGLAGKIIQMFS